MTLVMLTLVVALLVHALVQVFYEDERTDYR